MGKRDEKTITGGGVKGKRGRTTSDDVGGKSVGEESKSTGGKLECVGENSTGGKFGVIRSSGNILPLPRLRNYQTLLISGLC
jgi:hypothetical protein